MSGYQDSLDLIQSNTVTMPALRTQRRAAAVNSEKGRELDRRLREYCAACSALEVETELNAATASWSLGLEDMIPNVFAPAGDTVSAVYTLARVRSVLPRKTFAARLLSGLRCIHSTIGIGTFCGPDERDVDRRATIAAGAATPCSSLTSGSTRTARAGASKSIVVA